MPRLRGCETHERTMGDRAMKILSGVTVGLTVRVTGEGEIGHKPRGTLVAPVISYFSPVA